MLWIGTYADIEYCADGIWRSVRTAPIKSNVLTYPYSIPFTDEFEINAAEFDLSKQGSYRIRVSVAEDDNSYIGDTETIYGYFSVD